MDSLRLADAYQRQKADPENARWGASALAGVRRRALLRREVPQ
jgi:hypothetical protein